MVWGGKNGQAYGLRINANGSETTYSHWTKRFATSQFHTKFGQKQQFPYHEKATFQVIRMDEIFAQV